MATSQTTDGGRSRQGPAPTSRGAPLTACPRCGERRIWIRWSTTADRCPGCDYPLDRHGWVAALWINTWLTILAVMAWVVGGLVVTGGRGGFWITAGAVALAIAMPALAYRLAKGLMLRWLYHMDPLEGEEATHE